MRLQAEFLAFITAMALFGSADAGQRVEAPAVLSGDELVRKVEPSVALILVGSGAGQVSSVGSAVVVSSNGYLLTAYHLVKFAQQVQARMHNGEVYDQVELLGYDERRDVAALHIPAANLASLAPRPLDDVKQGEPAFTIANPSGLSWSASEGIISAIRMAQEIPGAGSGFRVLQFTCAVSPGSSGGALVDSQGRLLGIVTASMVGQGLNFAVPAESVVGLINSTSRRTLGSGKELDIKPPENPARSAINDANPKELLHNAETLAVTSHTSFFTPDALDRELAKKPEFSAWGIKIVKDERVADIIVMIDRPLFTYDFTYTATDKRTSIVLASGKVTAIDGVRAAPGIAKDLIRQMAKARETAKDKTPKK